MNADFLKQHAYYDDSERCECGWDPSPGAWTPRADHAAHVVAAWREHRTITSIAELDALPAGTLIRDASGLVGFSYASGWPDEGVFPALILWRPDEDGAA